MPQNFRPFVLLCLISVFVFGCGFFASAESLTNVMTYNIRYLNDRDGEDVWANRHDVVIETIASADVVGLQEVVLDQLQAVEAGTPGWTWYGVGRDDGKVKGEFAPIGFRNARFKAIDQGTLWLSETPEVPGSRGWDAALPRTLTWVLLQAKSDQKRLLVINTHFDHRGEVAREQAGKLIAERVDSMAAQTPVIVMGDFNALPESKPLVAALSGSTVALDDSRVTSVTTAKGPAGTWNGFKEIDQSRRIDHVLVSDRVAVASYEVLDPKTASGRFASDHLPILVKITFK